MSGVDIVGSHSGSTMSHHAYQMYAHVTWHTWQRVGCIDQACVEDVKRAVGIAARRARMHILRMAVLADHVHVILSFRPNTMVSEFIRVAKSGSAFLANKRIPGQLKWARGSYVGTFHRSNLNRQIGYVAAQYQRHP